MVTGQRNGQVCTRSVSPSRSVTRGTRRTRGFPIVQVHGQGHDCPGATEDLLSNRGNVSSACVAGGGGLLRHQRREAVDEGVGSFSSASPPRRTPAPAQPQYATRRCLVRRQHAVRHLVIENGRRPEPGPDLLADRGGQSRLAASSAIDARVGLDRIEQRQPEGPETASACGRKHRGHLRQRVRPGIDQRPSSVVGHGSPPSLATLFQQPARLLTRAII